MLPLRSRVIPLSFVPRENEPGMTPVPATSSPTPPQAATRARNVFHNVDGTHISATIGACGTRDFDQRPRIPFQAVAQRPVPAATAGSSQAQTEVRLSRALTQSFSSNENATSSQPQVYRQSSISHALSKAFSQAVLSPIADADGEVVESGSKTSTSKASGTTSVTSPATSQAPATVRGRSPAAAAAAAAVRAMGVAARPEDVDVTMLEQKLSPIGEDEHDDTHFDMDNPQRIARDTTFLSMMRGTATMPKPKVLRGWRAKVVNVLEHHYMQLVLLALIIIDLMAVFGEIMLSQVCSSDTAVVHHWEHGLHILSLTILFLFVAQQLLLLACFGKQYFHHWFYVVDLIVVSVAIILELAISSDVGGFIAVLLTWRVVRLIHGFVVSAEAEMNERKHALQKYRAAKMLLTIASGYTAVSLRMFNFKLAARLIQAWWRKHHRNSTPHTHSDITVSP